MVRRDSLQPLQPVVQVTIVEALNSRDTQHHAWYHPKGMRLQIEFSVITGESSK
jgi:hypothetical protein